MSCHIEDSLASLSFPESLPNLTRFLSDNGLFAMVALLIDHS